MQCAAIKTETRDILKGNEVVLNHHLRQDFYKQNHKYQNNNRLNGGGSFLHDKTGTDIVTGDAKKCGHNTKHKDNLTFYQKGNQRG